ncbi:MlaD family protein [Cerasicoccus maritimus]|uniref:MlaD family protein n=1 Tax=Cerasicoccus maritimus TaxID=490089 RepID=UPI002852C1BC|nr:MlaD family protein [Cerasicoccus maritimus]
MNTASQSIRVGLFFVLGVALIWIAYETLSGSRLERASGYRLEASFENLQQLKASDEVRMAGVRIGNVAETKLDGTKAVAVLLIDQNIAIPADSEATITTAGLLGTNYVAIVPGEDLQKLAAGAPINTFKTPGFNDVVAEVGQLGERLDQVFAKVEGSLDGLSGLTGGGSSDDGEGDLFSNLNQIVIENRDTIKSTLANFDQISGDIASGKGTIGKLIQDPAAYEKIMTTADDIKIAANNASALMTEAQSILDEVKTGKGALGTIIYDQQTGEDIKVTVANVKDFSSKLNSPQSSLGRFLNDDDLYVQAQDTLSKVNGAVSRFDDSGPITAVGILASALF